ncbi:5-oxoprolinase subunit PxpC [Acerihabitans arboris]|uniref:5-oxoprolinase/urea amidolyase family protein n=1 Tax=Acerihabitans arboris TaxID=2691583 RepID=A0A845SI78_9GAMM|nr:5-oxoprolinase subunit PxpC [Acerihabitans arboris]NDL62746.1 5-oxoprolinase/urea amidolyase family protein [Acerihabitans arboris]
MLKVIRAGMMTAVQDGGRTGYRGLGISQGGVLDLPAMHMANLLVDNGADAAVLEITLGQFSAEITAAGWLALTGADCHAQLDGKPVWTGWRFQVRPGQVIKLATPKHGMRSYLAVSGGFDVPVVLNSRSTDLKAGFGGHQGRMIRDGDTLRAGSPQSMPTRQMGIRQLLFGNRVRALPGPEYREFSADSQEAFWRSSWQLNPQSNRMGYRLQGRTLTRTTDRELFSHGVLPGVVQVPHSGQPIVLMADAQTTGGYPRIACVIAADLFHLAQIRLGEPIHFVQCTLEDAHAAWLDQQRYLEQIAWQLAQYRQPVAATGSPAKTRKKVK